MANIAKAIIGDSLLDVAGGDQLLKQYVDPQIYYSSIGLYDNRGEQSKHAITANLENTPLPCDDQSFSTVVASHVLEHIDNIHELFDEICRVSSDTVIIGLPNPASAILSNMIFADRRDDSLGITPYHSLPIQPPLDRHKWFYLPGEAHQFIKENGEKNGYRLDRTIYCVPSRKRKLATQILAKMLFSSTYPAEEFYIQDMWWVLRRSNKDEFQQN